MTMSFRLLLIAAALLYGGVPGAEETQPERITATADRLELDQQTGVQTLSGNVVIKQGDISIYGETIQVAMRNGAISRIYGAGEPIRFQQRLAGGDLVQTQSREIDYVTSSWTLVFRGDVKLQRNEWLLAGHQVEYNVRSRNFSANGAPAINTESDQAAPRVSITYKPVR
jgi:lipopolysaccharide export system protein LptA